MQKVHRGVIRLVVNGVIGGIVDVPIIVNVMSSGAPDLGLLDAGADGALQTS